MRLSRACACSLRRNATCSIPSSRTSSTKSARPVSSRASSLRRTRLPTSRGWGATGQLHRVDDVLVARAAAQVPAQRVADLRIAGGCVVAQERDERHEDARSAEAALQRVRLAESGLQRVELVRAARREALDGRQLSAVRLHRQHQAGAHRLAVEQHGAGAAHAVLAADVGAGEPQVLAQEVAQEEPRLDVAPVLDPVDGHVDRHVRASSENEGPTLSPTPRGGKAKRLLHSPSMHRREGLAKLTGRERYVDDLPLDDFLWGATVRSPAPRGRVTAVRFGRGIDWSQFVVVDSQDLPGPNEILLIERDQPVLAARYVRHVHEPVLLLAHRDRAALRRAVAAVTIEVATEPPALDFRVPPRPDQIQYGPDNLLKHLHIEKGDVERALANAALVIEGTYETGAQEHIYLEPQGMIAHVDGDVVVVRGSMQCPYYVMKALSHALKREEHQVRVVQTPTGGGFGGKEEYPSTIALHAALLALKSGRTV